MIYFVQRANGDIKIGTTIDFDVRLRALTYEHGNLQFLGWIEGGRDEEQSLHTQFSPCRVRGEWFKACEDLTAYILQNASRQAPEQSQHWVSVQFSLTANEALKILKRRYGVRTMSDALIRFVEEKDGNLMELANKRAALLNEEDELQSEDTAE